VKAVGDQKSFQFLKRASASIAHAQYIRAREPSDVTKVSRFQTYGYVLGANGKRQLFQRKYEVFL